MKRFILVTIMWLGLCTLYAQIDSNSKFVIDSVLIYRDVNIGNTFYYAPHTLQLVYDDLHKPDFQLLKMRYVGTQCYGDNQKAHETNLVQLQVEMNAISNDQLNVLKNKLKVYTAHPNLLPIPISHIESQLIVAADSVQNKQLTITSNESEAVDLKENTSKKSYWTHRFFTFRLENNEAILFENMLKSSDLAMSFSYAFFADTSNPLEAMSITGTTELVNEIQKNMDSIPKTLVNRMIFSDAFPIPINTIKFPDLIKNLDINESFPPTHATLTVKNYDFSENLRPELYLKKVEIAAISVDHDKEVLVETKFSKSTPEINSHNIFFPYAVYVNKPMKYRITEISLAGEKKTYPWVEFTNCNQILDVTSTAEEQKVEIYSMKIESDDTWFETPNTKLVVLISYTLHSQNLIKYVDVLAPDVMSISFYHDKGTGIFYEIVNSSAEQTHFQSEKRELNDRYLYVYKTF